MEEKSQDRGNVTAFDVQDAIRILQIQNTLLEGRFEIIGEALIKLSTGLKAIQQMMSPILPISDGQSEVQIKMPIWVTFFQITKRMKSTYLFGITKRRC